MPHFEEFHFDSCTGKNSLYALKCIPDGEVKGVVQIIHGIAERIERYRGFMEFLAENGFASVGDDHLGHGLSVSKPEERGVFYPEDGWDHVVKDVAKLHDMTIALYPNVKYIMFGHSMGSFLLRTYIANYPGNYDMAIISGTGHPGGLKLMVGNMIASNTIKKLGYASDGTSLSKLTMGNYQSQIENPQTDYDWLTRDLDVANEYAKDDLCGFVCAAGVYADMLSGIKYVTNMENINKIDKSKPVMFMSGDRDPVGGYGKEVKKAYKCFVKSGIKDVTLKLYPGGRHEMLNEINKDEVHSDILKWITKRL